MITVFSCIVPLHIMQHFINRTHPFEPMYLILVCPALHLAACFLDTCHMNENALQHGLFILTLLESA